MATAMVLVNPDLSAITLIIIDHRVNCVLLQPLISVLITNFIQLDLKFRPNVVMVKCFISFHFPFHLLQSTFVNQDLVTMRYLRSHLGFLNFLLLFLLLLLEFQVLSSHHYEIISWVFFFVFVNPFYFSRQLRLFNLNYNDGTVKNINIKDNN